MPMAKATGTGTGRAASRGEDTARGAWGLLAGLVYPPRYLDIARRLGVTPPLLGALHFLEQPQTMGAMADFLHCDPSNVTGIVDGLESRGLAERRPAEHDRRVKLVALSAEGRRLRAKILRETRRPPAWLRDLSAADQRALKAILERAS
jgi:MarR family transcriptional regulator, organic hydroperoxide resistance regulator